MDAGGHFALQIAAKPLQIATWLLLTAYRNLPTPYPTVPSPTLYDVAMFVLAACLYNTKRYRRQTDGRTTECTNSRNQPSQELMWKIVLE